VGDAEAPASSLPATCQARYNSPTTVEPAVALTASHAPRGSARIALGPRETRYCEKRNPWLRPAALAVVVLNFLSLALILDP
jgi:hypothetical protein